MLIYNLLSEKNGLRLVIKISIAMKIRRYIEEAWAVYTSPHLRNVVVRYPAG